MPTRPMYDQLSRPGRLICIFAGILSSLFCAPKSDSKQVWSRSTVSSTRERESRETAASWRTRKLSIYIPSWPAMLAETPGGIIAFPNPLVVFAGGPCSAESWEGVPKSEGRSHWKTGLEGTGSW